MIDHAVFHYVRPDGRRATLFAYWQAEHGYYFAFADLAHCFGYDTRQRPACDPEHVLKAQTETSKGQKTVCIASEGVYTVTPRSKADTDPYRLHADPSMRSGEAVPFHDWYNAVVRPSIEGRMVNVHGQKAWSQFAQPDAIEAAHNAHVERIAQKWRTLRSIDTGNHKQPGLYRTGDDYPLA